VTAGPVPGGGGAHLKVLDGWRGISILLVLCAHFLPLGPKAWGGNLTAGPMGMAIFFTLSGFLITGFLLDRPSTADFLVRRLARIVPLAWVAMIVALWQGGVPRADYLPHFLFFANAAPSPLVEATAHFWSLCVEMQFYMGIAALFALLGNRGLKLLPAACLAFTALRVSSGAEISIETPFRVDEILAGATLALAYRGRFGGGATRALSSLNPYALVFMLAISCHPDSGALNYLRPYLSAALVGATLFSPGTRLAELLGAKSLAYIASISYALYVVHPLVGHTWLGSGDPIERYAKRPLLFAAVFALAHVSTFHFEKHWIRLGRAMTPGRTPRATANPAGR
jgi:peptidoglycan/LPS O-acetylase OafA/YrhL